jgi:hypothetical protein
VDDLMSQDFKGAQQGNMKDAVKQSIIQLGLEYRLMTQFTSFVAVEEMIVTDGGQPRRIDVPVEVPEGVNRETAYGEGRAFSRLQMQTSLARAPIANRRVAETGKSKVAVGGGGPGGGGGGGTDYSRVYRSRDVVTLPAPVPSGTAVGPRDEELRLSPEQQKRAAFESKFHASVLAVITRLKDRKIKPAADEGKFVSNGKAEVQIWLTEKSDVVIAELKKLGFEVVLDPRSAKMFIGRIPIEKLAALADIKSVRYVAPQFSGN